ncbi:dihydropteroate synthase [Calorimonas adulescens]|jgi:Pterin binding enzyme.|uniref:Pterin-binding domain-containing protein n=1 Tax=Calorimonas adulescens TaxID=2606906 RepID=A0A5D8QAF4_9THEO|nr:dihydropteroate synthase [Calorimonas adulescens]TZE81580.1 hypothetical protein FWJ32_08665 [Calorimonas adulescens]
MLNGTIIKIEDIDEAKEIIKGLGADRVSINIMAPKALHINMYFEGVKAPAANIIKQEMLSAGGEVAVARGAVSCIIDKTDILIMGTLSQFKKLVKKLNAQPFFDIPDILKTINKLLFMYQRKSSFYIGDRFFESDRTYFIGGEDCDIVLGKDAYETVEKIYNALFIIKASEFQHNDIETIVKQNDSLCVVYDLGYIKDVIKEIKRYVEKLMDVAYQLGLEHSRLMFSPGIGINKNPEDDKLIMQMIDELKLLGLPIMIDLRCLKNSAFVCGYASAKGANFFMI